MVRVCYICKIYSHAPGAENLTFHGLPIGMAKRNLWLSVLGFDQEHQFPKKVEICSKHFDQSDYVYREDGSRYLKPYAAPLPIHSVFDCLDSESNGTESTVTAISSPESLEIDAITEAELDEKPVEERFKMETLISRPFQEKYLTPDAEPLPIHSAFVSLGTESTESESAKVAISSADEYVITIKTELDDNPAEERCLKQNAASLPIHPAFVSLDTESTGSEGAITAISSADEYPITIKAEFHGESAEERIKMETHISRPFQEKTSEVITACQPDSSTIIEDSSSSTLTASEIDDLAIEIPNDLTPKRRKKTIRYAGDLTSDDFLTPRKAIKNYRLMKATVDKQRRKIRSLQSTVLKLRKRIKTFQERFKTSHK